ncbi:MAG: ABC transporter permease subunit [Methylophilus sp.]|nr:ABC transporter permease subunit [Methylophilus sp.]MDP3610067.1 ABC transporter permease subunit [Methylophilus sp.]
MLFQVIRKEIKLLFASYIGWGMLAMFALVMGVLYTQSLSEYMQVMLGHVPTVEQIGLTKYIGANLFGSASLIMLVFIPLLSMRLLAEEQKNLTMAFMLSAPISLGEIVLGKFLSLIGFLMLMLVYLVLIICILNLWTDMDFGYIFANVLGLALLVSSFSAISLFISSLTRQPILAATLSFLVLILFLFLDQLFEQQTNTIWASLSMMQRYKSFAVGLLNTADIAFYLLVSGAFIFFTIRTLEHQRVYG